MRFAGVLGLALFTSLAFGQSGSSTISGSVKDASEAAIPAARLKITNIDTGVRFDTVTNTAGLYRAGALVPGSYRVEADAAGFDHLTRGPFTLQVSQTLALDLTLQVGQQNATVDVVESAPVNGVADFQYCAGGEPADAGRIAAAESRGVVAGGARAGSGDDRPWHGHRRKLSGIQRGGRAGAQSELHAGRRQCVQRGGLDASAAAHQPAGGRHAGIPRDRQ